VGSHGDSPPGVLFDELGVHKIVLGMVYNIMEVVVLRLRRRETISPS